jgi:hypothetical protein
MRARDRDLPDGAGAAFGVAHGLVGTGDALDVRPTTIDEAVAAATDRHGDKAGRMLRRFADVPEGAFVWTRMPVDAPPRSDSATATRSDDGRGSPSDDGHGPTADRSAPYRLGRITGPWRYDDSAAAREVGIHHVRPTEWLGRAFAEEELPAGVAHTFGRGGRNFQRTHDADAERETRELWDVHAAT